MWSDALATCDAAIASVFDEIEVSARARRQGQSVNDRTVDDESRQSFAFMGSISLSPPPASRLDTFDPGLRADRAASYGAVLTANIANWPWTPRRGDLVEAEGIQWVIVATDRHGNDRFVAWINRAK